jgi:hypothetical protein
MRAYWEGIFETRAGAGSGIDIGVGLGIDFMVVIIAHVLHEMIFTSKPICAPMTFAVLAWIFRFFCAEQFQMAIENIKPRELCTALTGIRLMLLLLGMAEEVTF